MVWSIACAGSAMLDDTATPFGVAKGVPGGSMVYTSIAAAHFAPVNAVGILGSEGKDRILASLAALNVNTEGVQQADGPTFREDTTHDYMTGVATIHRSEPGVYAEWEPLLSPAAAAADVLFVGSMHPNLQAAIQAQSRARLVAVDSMSRYIRAERHLVMQTVRAADLLFLNQDELADLVGGSGGWQEQATSLLGTERLRALVVKRGPEGAAYVCMGGVTEVPAHPVRNVVDPSGAGDALAGGFLGACAVAERDDDAFAARALRAGVRQAAAAISAFSVDGLLEAVDELPYLIRAKTHL